MWLTYYLFWQSRPNERQVHDEKFTISPTLEVFLACCISAMRQPGMIDFWHQCNRPAILIERWYYYIRENPTKAVSLVRNWGGLARRRRPQPVRRPATASATRLRNCNHTTW